METFPLLPLDNFFVKNLNLIDVFLEIFSPKASLVVGKPRQEKDKNGKMEKQKHNKKNRNVSRGRPFLCQKTGKISIRLELMTVVNVFKMWFLANSRHYSMCNGMFDLMYFR